MPECDGYLECSAQGDTYAAAAYHICRNTPNDAWSNCVRSCLLGKYDCNQSAWQNVIDHAACFAGCVARGLPRPPRLPGPGDIPRPSFGALLRQFVLG